MYVCVALSMRHRLDVIPTNTDSLGGLRERDELPVYTLEERRGSGTFLGKISDLCGRSLEYDSGLVFFYIETPWY